MARSAIAKLIRAGRSQAVYLPPEFQLTGNRVRLRRVGNGVLLEPIPSVAEWFAGLDRFGLGDFMPEGRNQPEMPPDREDWTR